MRFGIKSLDVALALSCLIGTYAYAAVELQATTIARITYAAGDKTNEVALVDPQASYAAVLGVWLPRRPSDSVHPHIEIHCSASQRVNKSVLTREVDEDTLVYRLFFDELTSFKRLDDEYVAQWRNGAKLVIRYQPPGQQMLIETDQQGQTIRIPLRGFDFTLGHPYHLSEIVGRTKDVAGTATETRIQFSLIKSMLFERPGGRSRTE